MAALAQQDDARLRAAFIPLFIYQPYLARLLPQALSQLPPYEQTTLKIYYTAAVILQEELSDTLEASLSPWHPLPDLYSAELGIRTNGNATQQLRELGSVHARLMGLQINWPGTYRHAAKQLIHRL